MDPAACLQAADAAVMYHDNAEARQHLLAYWAWRNRGGFEPIYEGRPYGDAMARQLSLELETILSRRCTELEHLLGY